MSEVKKEPNQVRSSKTSARKIKRILLLFVVPLLVIAASLLIYLHGGRYVETDNAYVKADKTLIAPVVSGRIIDVAVEENQHVSEGDLLLKIDPKPFAIAVEQAQANLNDVKTSLTTLKAEYQSKQANIAVAHSQFEYLKKEQKRQYDLLKQNYISQSEYDAAQQKTEVQKLEINALNKELHQIAETLGGRVDLPVEQHPKYQSALAALDKAENDLQHVNVYAPSSGIVTKVAEKGQYLAPGASAMLLVSDDNLWIEANFTETEASYMKPGQSATITVDYVPGYTWQGTIESLSPATGAEFSVIPAQNATGNWVKITQRLPVRIQLKKVANAPQLRAGLSAIVTVDTNHHRQLPM
ncbi:HlyD family secretion protein [Vibrio mangrovi]|uniref:HlyD family secretion protein n=1 Tax=Vibrio mangrovi TaxID=474394 RepID=A0A1Y6ISH3_9VIBR|nr:HlyD family secretion protein [Vibrio mangrovi]MDW6003754.1 HlyD family secretion protein [Vibrio mangrovi]SMR99452.1 Multidrug export protein EmrA [Vibrio mangrovi]